MLLPGKAQQVDINPGRTNAMNPSQPVIAQLLRSPPNDSAIRVRESKRPDPNGTRFGNNSFAGHGRSFVRFNSND
jgi:hypothetical protein